MRIVETGQDSPLLIDTQLRQRGRSHGKLPVGLGPQTESETEEELQRATMGYESDRLLLTGYQQTGIDCPDAFCHLQQGFAAWRGSAWTGRARGAAIAWAVSQARCRSLA